MSLAHYTVCSTGTKAREALIDSVITTVVSTLYMVICVELYSFLASFIKTQKGKKKDITKMREFRTKRCEFGYYMEVQAQGNR